MASKWPWHKHYAKVVDSTTTEPEADEAFGNTQASCQLLKFNTNEFHGSALQVRVLHKGHLLEKPDNISHCLHMENATTARQTPA
jgi:hypothetical protein